MQGKIELNSSQYDTYKNMLNEKHLIPEVKPVLTIE